MRNATFITLFGAAVSTFNLSDEATDSFPLSLSSLRLTHSSQLESSRDSSHIFFLIYYEMTQAESRKLNFNSIFTWPKSNIHRLKLSKTSTLHFPTAVKWSSVMGALLSLLEIKEPWGKMVPNPECHCNRTSLYGDGISPVSGFSKSSRRARITNNEQEEHQRAEEWRGETEGLCTLSFGQCSESKYTNLNRKLVLEPRGHLR